MLMSRLAELICMYSYDIFPDPLSLFTAGIVRVMFVPEYPIFMGSATFAVPVPSNVYPAGLLFNTLQLNTSVPRLLEQEDEDIGDTIGNDPLDDVPIIEDIPSGLKTKSATDEKSLGNL